MNVLHYSWKEFLICIILLLLVYYACVILRYYRQELLDYINGKPRKPLAEQSVLPSPASPYREGATDQAPIAADDFLLAEELILRLKELIAQSDDQQDSADLLRAIGSVLLEYPSLQDPILQSGITALILSTCKQYGDLQLDRREVEALWRRASS